MSPIELYQVVVSWLFIIPWYYLLAIGLVWLIGAAFAVGLNHKDCTLSGSAGFWTVILWPLVVTFWLLRLAVPPVCKFFWPILKWCGRMCSNPLKLAFRAGVALSKYIERKEVNVR